MDPDHVDAAAGFHRGDLDDTTTSLGGGGCAGSEDSWARALLRRGWDLSRKVAIAGAAATAAPVVAPPIIILSVAGVVLSLPFAAYLASLAATDRLMGALLPPSPAQPYHACHLEDEESELEFLDASEAPGEEASVFDYWSKTEDDAIMEENESFASLPLSREPRLSEEPVSASANEEDTTAEGEFPFQELGYESFVSNSREQKEEGTTMEDNEFITMEAPSQGFDVSGSAVPVLCDEDDMDRRMVDAPRPAEESVQVFSVSDNGDKTEDGKCTATEEMESGKEMPPHGIDVSEFPVRILGKEDFVIQREGEGEVSVGKPGHDSHVSDSGDKIEQHKTTEEMPPQEVNNVSELSVPEDNTVQSKIEGEVTVEMVLEEVTTDLVTGEVIDVEMDVIAVAVPESESLQPSDLVARELQAAIEAAIVDDISGTVVTEDKEVVEHHGEGIVHCFVPVASAVTVDDDEDLVSSRTTHNVSAISDVMMGVESRTHVEHRHQTTSVESTQRNKGFGKKEVAEDKFVKTDECKTRESDMAPRDIDVSESSLPDYNTVPSKRGDELIVEMVLEEVTSNTDLVTGEVVDVQMDIIASESESVPLSDLVAHELLAVTEAAIVDDIRGSTVMEDIVKKDIGDTNTEGVEDNEGATCSFVSVAHVVTVHDDEDLMSSRITPYVSAISDDLMSVEGKPDVDHPHQTVGVEYKVMNEGFGTEVVPDDKDIYTEEQLRDQLDTLRTITGCRAVPSLTLEGELASLYIFVGVEPPVSSTDASDLTELNAKLRFLKSIIGVE